MNTLSKVIQELEGAEQNKSGMFEVGEETMCALMGLLTKEREAAVPVAYIFKHPSGKLFWALTDESNKGRKDVMPVYDAPPAQPVAVPDEATWEDAPANCENVDWAQGWNACRADMLKEAK